MIANVIQSRFFFILFFIPIYFYILISKLIYGCSASNEYDLQAIEAIADYWIGSIATGKRDYELTKLKYKIPSSFCSLTPKIASMQQSFESIPPYQLEAPEACHLLPSPSETVIGDDIYIITRLNKLIDAMPPSPTNFKLFNRPVTPFDSNNLIIFSMTVNRFVWFSFVSF